MNGRTPGGGPRVEDLLKAVPITVAELRGAVGRFEGGTAAMVKASIETAERAFAELDACDRMIDKAGARGEEVAGRLQELLAREAREKVAAELAALDEIAAEIRQSSGTLRLLNGILGRDTAVEDDVPTAEVPSLREADLPQVPSAYGDEAEYADLMEMADRGAELAPGREPAHRQRLSDVAAHLVTVVQQVAKTGFADKGFAQASLQEARAAHGLWLRCLEQRRRDLGR